MAELPLHLDTAFSLPPGFFDQIIADIPVPRWVSLFSEHPTLRNILLEGLSAPPHKWQRLLRQPQILGRLRRGLAAHREALEGILKVWGQEQLSVVAFLEMLDRDFLLESWTPIKNLVGPERFFAALALLELTEDPDFREQLIGLDADFWQRTVDENSVEPLIPFSMLWNDLIARFPQAQGWLAGAAPAVASASPPSEALPPAAPEKESRTGLHREEERRRKVEQKLQKALEEGQSAQEQIARLRRENEELRRQVAREEVDLNERIEEALARERRRWYDRFESTDLPALKNAQPRLESLLQRAERALDLQRKADEEYGTVAGVRQSLVGIELRLREIERVYADSLVVHPEVAKVKEALEKERQRLLAQPNIERVLRLEPSLDAAAGLSQSVRLTDTTPENLSRIVQVENLVKRLQTLGFLPESHPLAADVRHKKRQILEALYARFEPPRRPVHLKGPIKTLEDFVRSGQSRQYDLYVDGYNILLKLVSGRNRSHAFPLAELREDFIRAVCGKSSLFRKVFLVFDGIEDSRDRQGNVEIIFTDKSQGTTADSVLMGLIRKRSDNRALLVTADNEIIDSVASRVYAIIAPFALYTFVFDTLFPVLPENAKP